MMLVVRRSKTVAASPERVWQIVSDPEQMPEWWPLVKRVEGVGEDQFTQVLTTKKGRLVRADFRVVVSDPPGTGGEPSGRRVWEQEMAGTPFGRFLDEASTEIVVEPEDGATRVTIALTQKLRGYSRTGGFLWRRATRGRLDQALQGLDQAVLGA